jgi:hypothetical protein
MNGKWGQSISFHISTQGRADDADHLPGRTFESGKRRENALSEFGRIGVFAFTEDDSGMGALAFARQNLR